VNFKRGANPPRSEGGAAAANGGGNDAAFERFALYVDHIKAIDGVKFVTARELPERYPDRVSRLGVRRRIWRRSRCGVGAEDSAG